MLTSERARSERSGSGARTTSKANVNAAIGHTMHHGTDLDRKLLPEVDLLAVRAVVRHTALLNYERGL